VEQPIMVSSTTSTSPLQPPFYARDGATYYDDEEEDYVVVNDPTKEGGIRQWCDKYCCCCCCFYCKNGKVVLSGVALAIIYWVVLYVFAHAYSPGYQRFTLTVGETFKVQPPMNLWSRKSISIQAFPVPSERNSSAAPAGLEVYEFLPVLDYGVAAPCPPLTLGDDPSLGVSSNSPILTLHESEERIQLGAIESGNKQYEFEYFHLNEGSILQVHAELVAPPSSHHKSIQMGGGGLGATNIYILQGFHDLHELETNPRALMHDFRGKSIEKRFLAFSGALDLEYVVTDSDYYIIIYDNAAPGRATNLQVSVTVRMATHYLSEVSRPICSAKNTMFPHGCAWTFTNDQDRQRVASTCIIAKAVSPRLNQEIQNQLAATIYRDVDDVADTANEGSGSVGVTNSAGNQQPRLVVPMEESQSVIVEVHAPLGSTRFVVLALAPIIILATIWFLENGQRCIQHVRRHGCAAALCPCCPRGEQQNTMSLGKEQMLPLVDERTPLNNTGGPSRPKR
jgi:hypothetical protein